MTWRMCSVLMLVLAGCEESNDEPGPPPLTSGPGTTLPVASASATDTDGSGTDTDTDTATDGVTSMPTDTTGAPEEFTVIDGAFIDGAAAVELPIQCRITFYEPGQIEPSTGVPQGSGHLFQLGGFTIDAYPQSFTVESMSVPMVELGAEGYVAAECDADGNALFDDDVGGWFPGLPLQRVTVPASNVYIPIQSM